MSHRYNHPEDYRQCSSCGKEIHKDNCCGCVVCNSDTCGDCIVSIKDVFTNVERLIADEIIRAGKHDVAMYHSYGCICPECLSVFEEAFIKTIPLLEIPTYINHAWHTAAGTAAYKQRYL
jgi:hypothetical protein